MKSLANEVEFNFLVQILVKTNRLHLYYADIIILLGNSKIVLEWRTVETKDLDVFGRAWLPFPNKVKRLFAGCRIVFLVTNRQSHVAIV